MICAIDEKHVYKYGFGNQESPYVEGIISLKIGHSIRKYESIKDNYGVLVLEQYESKLNLESGKLELTRLYEDEEKQKPSNEYYKRLIVGSNHTRGKKAYFVRVDLYDKLDKILLGGIDELKKVNHYPNYEKGAAKWNSYYGLPSTDSKPVSEIPNIVVIKDFKRVAEDTFDEVVQTKEKNPKWKSGDDEKDKYVKKYDVNNNVFSKYEILPFDGAGLVSVETAQKWSEELGIVNSKGKSYIPAAFQFRVIPGFKGNLYTFDIVSFAKEYGSIITDINDVKHDLSTEEIDVIFTESQAKFLKLFGNDVKRWKDIFEKPVIFYKKDVNGKDAKEIESSYQRTFNISEYSEDVRDIKVKMLTAYQHLHSLHFNNTETENEMETFSNRTVDMFKKISTDPNEFLQFRSCTEELEVNDKKDWNRIPPYYRVAYYLSRENREVLFEDRYFQKKAQEDILGLRKRILSGKLYVTGNYQVLTPDIFALAQYAFGKRGYEVTGLLKSEEIYSNWWIYKDNKEGNEYSCDKMAITRNPEIYMEARTVSMVDRSSERYKEMLKWFKYQTTGIVTDSYSTVPLALGTADFDGDHVATTNCKEYVNAIERARNLGDGNTIILKVKDMTENEMKSLEANISDVNKLMEFDILAYRNNIGSVIDKVSTLWGVKQTKENKDEVRRLIKIMVIVGQLTIDAAKSGEFEGIPSEIEDYIKKNHVLKPYFMRYLPKNSEKLKKEMDAIKNAETIFGKASVVERQKKFSDEPTNLNLLCHYLENEINKIDVLVCQSKFDIKKFFSIFMTQTPCETSALFINIKQKLKELVKEHNSLHRLLGSCKNEEEIKERDGHYRHFYIYAKNELLSQCKLTEEKSMNKVVNCILYMSYALCEFTQNDGAKNILWNCFGNVLIKRAKGNNDDCKIDLEAIEQRLERIKNKRNKKSDSLNRKLVVRELEPKNPIIVTNDEVKYIRKIICNENLELLNIPIKLKDKLRTLSAVLFVISKKLEYKYTIKERPVHRKKKIIINSGGNNCINYSNIAKLCGFNDYDRKRMLDLLMEVEKLGIINFSSNNMDKLNIGVVYDLVTEENWDGTGFKENDYAVACGKFIKMVKTNKKIEHSQ